MSSASADSHTWYLDASEYYVPPEEAEEYPIRFGDVFTGGIVPDSGWAACQLVHPTCELAKADVELVQVVRVNALSEIEGRKNQGKVVAGFSEKNGEFRVAYAHTFFLPPIGEGPAMFSNFREISTIPQSEVTLERRMAALTHEARVTLIRRKIYWRYRIGLTYADVQAAEARRISRDDRFKGPRPDWAAYEGPK